MIGNLPADLGYYFSMFARRIIIILSMAVLLAACSTRFVYKQLDWLIVWQVGDYVTLTGEQKDELREEVRNHLEDIRVNEMPRLAAEISQVAAAVADDEFSAARADDTYERILAISDEFLLGIVPLSAKFLRQLDDEQREELFENLDDLNEEMYEDYSGVDPEQRRKNRNKSTIRSIKRFTGRLKDEQKALIDNSLASMADASEQWIEYQRDWQRRFRELLKANPPRPEFEARLTDLFVYPRNFHSAEYRARVDNNRQIMNQMIEDLTESLSDKQRRRAVEKLESYAERLTRLANSP